MPVDGRNGLRYLSADDVTAAMPPLDERLRSRERTMVALVAGRRAAAEDRRSIPRPARSGTRCRPHLRTRSGWRRRLVG
jgi:hypothetical protein